MSTSTDVDLTIIEDLDFNPTCVGCPVALGCDEEATWLRIIPTACEHLRYGYLCDEHKAESIERSRAGGNFCTICYHVHTFGGDLWEPIR